MFPAAIACITWEPIAAFRASTWSKNIRGWDKASTSAGAEIGA
jgi:hypothetical protein